MAMLGELVDITGGGTPSRKVADYWGGDIPWATVKDFKGLELKGALENITQEGLTNSASNLIPAGSIILPTRMAVGKAAVNLVDIAINQDLKALRIKDPTQVDRDYLFRILLSKSDYLESRGKGATVKGITLDVLRELEFPLPLLDEQKRIAAILDKANAIRSKRQQAIELTDQLLRSVFLDMFGDPMANPKGWEEITLESLTSKIGSGATPRGGKSAYVSKGISLIRSLNIHDNKFLHKNLAFITNQQADRLSNVKVEDNDVLLNITGASVCRCAMVDSSILPARVNQHVCIIRTIRELINPTFLLYFLITDSYKRKLLNIANTGGATREALTKEQVQNLIIFVPPIDIQEKFEVLVKKILVKRNKDKDSSKNSDELFSSLTQYAFRGELTKNTEAA